MRDYELVVIVSPEGGDDGFPTTVDRITNFITERGGNIKNVDPWGRRRLAYPIRRHLDGYYAVTHFAAEPQAIRPLEANLDLAEDILRHLVIKVDEDKNPRVNGAAKVTAPEGNIATDEATDATPDEAPSLAASEEPAVAADAEPSTAARDEPGAAADEEPGVVADEEPAFTASEEPGVTPDEAADVGPDEETSTATDDEETK